MAAKRRKTVLRRGVESRRLAWEEGQAAGRRIAKARALKKKKEPITAIAKGTHRRANALEEVAQAWSGYTRKTIAEAKKQTKIDLENGTTKRTSRTIRNTAVKRLDAGEMPHLSGWRITQKQRDDAADQVADLRKASKNAARKSGGYASAIKRNAEAGIEHIVRGRVAKTAARAAGVLGIASLFASHLSGKIKKDRRG